jgi:hypothetical protein
VETATRRCGEWPRWGDSWYGFNLDGAGEAAQRIRYLRACCDDAGRDIADLHVAVALRDQTPPTSRNSPKPASASWSSSRNPPSGPQEAATWVTALADRWQPDRP